MEDDKAVSSGYVHVGTRVDVELIDELGAGERMTFDIVSDQVADFSAGFLAAGTPLAKAILGQPAGAGVPYRVADVVEVRILRVTASTRTPDAAAAESRRAAVQEAVSRSNLEDAVRLALTVDVKWGDYDPEGIETGWDE